MKALILNSGMGNRMGRLTSDCPKCMTDISATDTILSRQLNLIMEAGITEVVITTGYFNDVLINYCKSLNIRLHFNFVHNPIYEKTNYIYSIYCARKYLDDDILLMHGDLVFEATVLNDILAYPDSCMKVSSTLDLPDKDFKAVVHNGKVEKIGIEFFKDAMEAQPLYKLNKADWQVWLNEIISFCDNGCYKCYAENAFNQISNKCIVYAFDVKDRLCLEIDTPMDLKVVLKRLNDIENHIAYI